MLPSFCHHPILSDPWGVMEVGENLVLAAFVCGMDEDGV